MSVASFSTDGTTALNAVAVTPGAGTRRAALPMAAAEQHDAHALHLWPSAWARLEPGRPVSAPALEDALCWWDAWPACALAVAFSWGAAGDWLAA